MIKFKSFEPPAVSFSITSGELLDKVRSEAEKFINSLSDGQFITVSEAQVTPSLIQVVIWYREK
ncbi:MAG: hypothetical protein ACE5G5_06210 [Candidatus Methylomirabilales bacterium]